MGFIPLYVYFVAVSFIASLLIYQKPNPYYGYLKIFPFFLLATFLAEFYGSYLSSQGENNVALYNFFTVFEFFFYQILISLIVNNRRIKMIMQICSLIYVLIATANILFFQGLNTFHTITYSLACLIIVGFCVYYFWELFKFPKSIKLTRTPAFWICSGLLFFYCCSFPLYGFLNVWSNVPIIVKNFMEIVTILNIFLYSTFTIAFLCVKTRKYTSSSL